MLKVLSNSTCASDEKTQMYVMAIFGFISREPAYVEAVGAREHTRVALLTTVLRYIRVGNRMIRDMCVDILLFLLCGANVTWFRDMVAARPALLLKVKKELTECVVSTGGVPSTPQAVENAQRIVTALEML